MTDRMCGSLCVSKIVEYVNFICLSPFIQLIQCLMVTVRRVRVAVTMRRTYLQATCRRILYDEVAGNSVLPFNITTTIKPDGHGKSWVLSLIRLGNPCMHS